MTVLITGANRGIGRALKDGYSARGITTIGTARAVPDAEDPQSWCALDVTAPDMADHLRAAIGDQPLELLICNAGVYLDKAQALDTGYDAQLWADSFATNVTGVFQTIQALLPNLRAAKGKIAIISSQMASDTHAPGGSYAYRASKAAVLNLGRNLASDLKPDGVSVGIYHPGWVRTDMGSTSADLSVDEARDGLMARFDDLSLDTTGTFETWDGRTHPF